MYVQAIPITKDKDKVKLGCFHMLSWLGYVNKLKGAYDPNRLVSVYAISSNKSIQISSNANTNSKAI